jgi:sulfur carrier protein
MLISVNGERRETDAETLGAALVALGYGGRKIATAVNGQFVAATQRERTKLIDGDQVEVVAPMQGG